MFNSSPAFLKVNGGIWDGMAIELARRPMVLGRHPDNDIVIEDATVSRRHALVAETPSGFVVRDLNSTNGTYVDGGRIDVEHILSGEARIRLGASKITLVFTQDAVSTVAMRSDPTASPA